MRNGLLNWLSFDFSKSLLAMNSRFLNEGQFYRNLPIFKRLSGPGSWIFLILSFSNSANNKAYGRPASHP